MRYFMFVFMVIAAGSGCGNLRSDPVEVEDASSPDTAVFVITDTLGVLMGNEPLQFGSIADVEFSASGDIMVLDALKGKITVLTPSGEPVETIGGHGAGPGEFQYPNSFAQLYDGRIIICDFSGASLSFFNPDHSFSNALSGFYMIPPVFPCAGPDGSYYAGCMEIRAGGETEIPTGESFLGLYSEGMEPDLVLVSHPLQITVAEGDVNVDNVQAFWDSDSEGNVFWAVSDDSTYVLVGMSPDGIEIMRVEKEWERVEKSEEELQMEIYQEGLSRSDEGSSTVNRNQVIDPYPYHPAIAGVYVDDQNRIWVEQGYTPCPVFEVYSPSGELIRIASIPELAGVDQLRYCFHGGFLAYDVAPDDYPKIYLLDIDME